MLTATLRSFCPSVPPQLLRHNPEHRMPLVDVAAHPWIRKYAKSTKSGSGQGL